MNKPFYSSKFKSLNKREHIYKMSVFVLHPTKQVDSILFQKRQPARTHTTYIILLALDTTVLNVLLYSTIRNVITFWVL